MNTRIERLFLELRRRGVLTAREMQQTIGAGPATLSRLLAGPDAKPIIRLGRARATRYALLRDVRGLGSHWPLYTIDSSGDAALVGQLYALTGGRWLLQQNETWPSLAGDDFADGLYPGLPWFLQDTRPRGFVGRLIAQRCADELGLPPDPRAWNDDDTVHFLLSRGYDLPGSFILGRHALTAAQSATVDDHDVILEQDRTTAYPSMAEATLEGEAPGSSAAGEQPKCTARIGRVDGRVDCVIVKFSGAGGRPEDERWSDLLVAEHVANSVLTEAGVPCATTEVLVADGRLFLESSRFDRVGQGGRRGFVSLESLDSAFFGELGTSWAEAAVRYRHAGWLANEDPEHLSLLWWFGKLIGNTDMHYGNEGVYLGEDRPLALAPTYDMVPMRYRPNVEGVLPDDMVPLAPHPPESHACWLRATELARLYWTKMAEAEHVSTSFRELSVRNAREIEKEHASHQ